MYANDIKVGHDFEVEVFGPGRSDRPVNNEVYKPDEKPDEFSRAVLDFLATANASDISATETAKLIFFYIRKYLKSIRLPVVQLRIYSTRETKLDRLFGTDALVVARVGRDIYVVSIDAYAARTEEVIAIRKETSCYRDFQSGLYEMKHWKVVASGPGPKKEFYAQLAIKRGRPGNHVLFTPHTLHWPGKLKEFSRHVAVSIWQQLHEGVDLRYCSISGFMSPAPTNGCRA